MVFAFVADNEGMDQALSQLHDGSLKNIASVDNISTDKEAGYKLVELEYLTFSDDALLFIDYEKIGRYWRIAGRIVIWEKCMIMQP